MTAAKANTAIAITFMVSVLIGWWVFTQDFGAASFVDDVTGQAAKLLASLSVVALFVERSLAALNAGIFAKERRSLQADTVNAVITIRSEPDSPAAKQNLARVYAQMAVLLAKEDKTKIYIGFVFSLLISAVGVRTLEAILKLNLEGNAQREFAHVIDMVLTAGLITGGSKSLSDLLAVIKHNIMPPDVML